MRARIQRGSTLSLILVCVIHTLANQMYVFIKFYLFKIDVVINLLHLILNKKNLMTSHLKKSFKF